MTVTKVGLGVTCRFFLPPAEAQQQRHRHTMRTKIAIPEPDAAPAVELDPPPAIQSNIVNMNSGDNQKKLKAYFTITL